jgi:hypothetical protein
MIVEKRLIASSYGKVNGHALRPALLIMTPTEASEYQSEADSLVGDEGMRGGSNVRTS